MNEKNAFVEKIIDWKDFELFVADIYSESDEVEVKHDVTLIGKSNAKRQIDVLVTQKTKLHTFITIIECKMWKRPVTRQVIDVLFASVEDLNANKGAIFTTKAYEEGAIEYAKSKNIDIFIIRDIREDEFGNLGKEFSLYLQTFNAKLENFDIRAYWYSPLNLPPEKPIPKFGIHFTKEQSYPENMRLVDLSLKKGPHFIKLLIDIRSKLLGNRLGNFDVLLQPEDTNIELGFKTRVKLDFSNYSYRFISHENGFIRFDTIYFDFVNCISQSKMNFDRTESFDLALVVENYISQQRNYISKSVTESKIKISEPIVDKPYNKDEVLQPNSIIKVMTKHWVNFVFKEDTLINNTEEITVNLMNE